MLGYEEKLIGLVLFIIPFVTIWGYIFIFFSDLEEEKKERGYVSFDFYIKKFIKFVLLVLFLAFLYQVLDNIGYSPKYYISKVIGG